MDIRSPMSYTVLARRYRSKDFDDLIGQEPIAQTLRNAVQTGRVAHAYLFCGTRGVGKTSMARILAKALNCVKGPTDKPCNACDRCLAIAAGEDIDVIEIDGASNRGIDEIRNLRNNAIYRPTRSPYKIYIIDEVHMLTKEAFNALLKTLEEPPEHVKFIFATTEAQRVPATILSRCQEFQFRLIGTQQIADRLALILGAEKIKAAPAVLERVARAGRGSMRDALSLMDQLLAMGAETLTESMVEYLLGEPAREQVARLVDHLADGDAAAALRQVDQLLAGGYAPEQFVVAMIEQLRRLLLANVVGADCDFLDVAAAEEAPLTEQAARFNAITLVYMIQVLESLRQSVRNSAVAARALIDAAIVRLALAEQFADTAELVDRLAGGESSAPAGPAGSAGSIGAAAGGVKKNAPLIRGREARSAGSAGPDADGGNGPANLANGSLGPPMLAPETPLNQVAPAELWREVIARLSAARLLALAGPLMHAHLVRAEGETLAIAAPAQFQAVLATPRRQEQLERALGELLSRRIRVQWVAPTESPTAPGEAPGGGSMPPPRPAHPAHTAPCS